jgi:hypothetical protein
MQPYIVKLTAYGRPFATVVLEVGYDELGATSDGSADTLLPDEIADMFAALGLPSRIPDTTRSGSGCPTQTRDDSGELSRALLGPRGRARISNSG